MSDAMEQKPLINRDNNYKRLEKDEYFILMCFLVAKRSHDAQTQCGCVMVKDGAIISTGFNGFLRGADDNNLPNLRPEKYPFIVHSEANAIYNAVRHGINLDGATAYITGQCCPECLKSMIQSGITEIVYTNYNDHSTAQQEKSLLDKIIKMHKVHIRIIDVDKNKIETIRSITGT
jgi:dCMP deaminase